jgi:RNA polymerase sigma factor (sigma-70 family)
MTPPRREQLARALEELPARCREVLLLRKVYHLRVEQICLHLGVSRDWVERHLRKALLHCQKSVSDGSAA